MSAISIIRGSFSEAIEGIKIELKKCETNTYYDSFYISGAQEESNSMASLSTHFGGRPVRIIDIKDENLLRIDISKVDTTEKIINQRDFLKYIKNSVNKGWFLGLSNFGPEHFELDNFTHAMVTGATGYGKSSFFKQLMSQTLNYQEDIVNYIVDPKRVDYKHLLNHPRVGMYADTIQLWQELFAYITVELKTREYYFANSFTTPPTKLSEYNEEIKKHKKTDAPKFKRMFIWIDEAHEVVKMDNYNKETDLLRSILEYIARKGRAFGIHLIFSSQKINDINFSIRVHCQTQFVFWQSHFAQSTESEYFKLGKTPLIKRPGVLHYLDDQYKRHDVLTPFVNQNEAIIISCGEHKIDQENRDNGFYRMKVHKDFFNNIKYLENLISGHDIGKLAIENTVSTYRGKDKVYSMFPNRFYDNIKTDEIQEENTNKKEQKTMAFTQEEQKSLLDSFEDMLGCPKDDTKEKVEERIEQKKIDDKERQRIEKLFSGIDVKATRDALAEALKDDGPEKPEQPKEQLKEETIKDSAMLFRFADLHEVDNSFKLENLKSTYLKFYNSSKENFVEFTSDISSNYSYQRLIELLNTDTIVSNENITFPKLAVSKKDQVLLNRYIEDTKTCLSLENKAPLLILSGDEGFGRMTIARAVMHELGIKIATKNNDKLIEKEEMKKIRQCNIFHDSEKALKHHRSDSKNLTVLIQGYLPGKGLFSAPYLPDFKYVKDYHINLLLEESDYAEPEAFTKLIETLLEKHKYKEEVTTETISILTSANIRTTPSKIDALIGQASQRAFHLGIDFDKDILEQTIMDYREKLAKESTDQIDITKPLLKLSDIKLDRENENDLLDVIHRTKNLGNFKYQFAKNIRQNAKVIALFAGPPGTGKSMSAEVLASETNRDLWRLDLGMLQSKYVGETEKTLSRVFNLAKSANAVLLLDECDSLLTNRQQEVNEYSKKISNHLLNLMENFNGVLILTTNNPESIDSAFSRRIDVKSYYNLPSKQRLIEMLKEMLLPDAPLSEGFSFEEVLDGIEISGGVLRNAVERIIVRMERYGSKEITNELAKECLLESQHEDDIINKQQRMNKITFLKDAI